MFKDHNEEISWSGEHNGISVQAVILADQNRKCILLLDPNAYKKATFENLICINRSGFLVWKAKLPANPDLFVQITREPNGVGAITWSGMEMVFDEETGSELNREFVK